MAAAAMVIDDRVISRKDTDQPVPIANAGTILRNVMLFAAGPMSATDEQTDHQYVK